MEPIHAFAHPPETLNSSKLERQRLTCGQVMEHIELANFWIIKWQINSPVDHAYELRGELSAQLSRNRHASDLKSHSRSTAANPTQAVHERQQK